MTAFESIGKVVEMSVRVLDGGMGKYLQRCGLPDEKLWSAKSIIDAKYHEMVINAHYEYLLAGSTIITTNNYALTPRYLKPINCTDKLSEWTKLACQLANKARQRYINYRARNSTKSENRSILIAGSIPPLMKSYRNDLRLNKTESIKYYTEIVTALYQESVDIFLMETMSCIEEAMWILEVFNNLNIKKNKDKEIWISFTLNDNGYLRSNETMNDAIKQICIQRSKYDFNITVIGINCCLPEAVEHGLNQIVNDKNTLRLLTKSSLKIGIYPNFMESIKTVNKSDGGWYLHQIRSHLTPSVYYNKFVKKWLTNTKYRNIIGALGGCCGVEPIHIKYMVSKL